MGKAWAADVHNEPCLYARGDAKQCNPSPECRVIGTSKIAEVEEVQLFVLLLELVVPKREQHNHEEEVQEPEILWPSAKATGGGRCGVGINRAMSVGGVSG